MASKEEHYSNGEITVVWKKDLCTHSGRCFQELPAVFDPPGDAFMDLTAAPSAAIMAQVDRCPSGALTYLRRGEPRDKPAERGGELVVEVLRNGPVVVKGEIVIKDSSGAQTRKSGATAFCRCGLSDNKPFCDGSHAKGNFQAD